MAPLFYQLRIPCRMIGLGSQPVRELVMSPFFPHFCVSFALNIVPAVIGLGFNNPLNENCAAGSGWLMWNSILCLINIVAALILLHKVRTSSLKQIPQNNDLTMYGVFVDEKALIARRRKEAATFSTMARVFKSMCEEPLLGVYWFVMCWWLVWLGIGIYRTMALNEKRCEDVIAFTLISVGFGVSYILCALLAHLCSWCCDRSKQKKTKPLGPPPEEEEDEEEKEKHRVVVTKATDLEYLSGIE